MPCRTRDTILKWDLQGRVCLTDIKSQLLRLTQTDDGQWRKKCSDALIKVATESWSPRVFPGGFIVLKKSWMVSIFPRVTNKNTTGQKVSLFHNLVYDRKKNRQLNSWVTVCPVADQTVLLRVSQYMRVGSPVSKSDYVFLSVIVTVTLFS